jgi:uncharacterized membrane protein
MSPKLDTNPVAPSAPRVAEPPLWHVALAVVAVALYGLLSHALMVHAAQAPWAVAVLFGPLLLAMAAAAWRQGQRLVLWFCAAVLAVLVAVVWRGGVDDINRMYVLQHAGIHAALAWAFASTLRPGATPLITALAQRVHLQFTPAMRHYTDRLTRAWALYFGAMIVLSLAVYAWAPWPWWSLFCNLGTPLAVAVFFVTEHALRYRRHPEFERVSLRGAIQAWRNHAPNPAPDQNQRGAP